MTAAPKACVIGWPARHSRSPVIHGHWLERHGLQGSYTAEDVAEDDLAAFVRGLREEPWRGCNVTVPHKVTAASLVDRLDEAAQALGAVNTIWREDGELVGGNTDGYGFLASLDEGAPGWDEDLAHAVVLGAGGAARAIVHGLSGRGARRISVVNRNAERANELASQVAGPVEVAGWGDVQALLVDADLLVNTTSLGMEGKPSLEMSISELPPRAVVSDIVYVPLETELLRTARARELRTVDGLGMLLHQAVPGFERWFGVRPQVDQELRRRVVATLEAR
ncbi:shikimate dehydrogenase [Lutibaculum baratangense]|uniref:Shikimate dehydrogenase (NADP(+)) n=1 Tax=Lutibaculum baratangense AMV1 TaxID=631454 RepID=V4RL73_9HYPH|nr:shikimate dehydrogenase [Lutibaculum baratangense]ESR26054.1 Shikimate 5-dehydrogenase I alpha [Lutibaculum baratangense AMV1]